MSDFNNNVADLATLAKIVRFATLTEGEFMQKTIIDNCANIAEIKIKLKIETDKVQRCVKTLIEPGMPETDFTKTLLQLWNQGLLRLVSFTTTVELISSKFTKPFEAYSFLLEISKDIDEEERLLADMLMFHFLYDAFPLEDVKDTRIPKEHKRHLLGLFMNLFHIDSTPYNNLYKVSEATPCPYEDALIKNIRRIALSWLTVPVYVFDSQKKYRCVPTNMILDIGRFPHESNGVRDAFNDKISAIHGDNFRGTFTQKEIFQILQCNGIAFEGIVGLPHYTERGLPATQICIYKPSQDSENPLRKMKYSFILSGKNDIALKILYSLCTTGVYDEKDETNHGSISSIITRRLSSLIASFQDIEIKKPRHEAWRLFNKKTKMYYESFPLVLYFPLLKNRQEKI